MKPETDTQGWMWLYLSLVIWNLCASKRQLSPQSFVCLCHQDPGRKPPNHEWILVVSSCFLKKLCVLIPVGPGHTTVRIWVNDLWLFPNRNHLMRLVTYRISHCCDLCGLSIAISFSERTLKKKTEKSSDWWILFDFVFRLSWTK